MYWNTIDAQLLPLYKKHSNSGNPLCVIDIHFDSSWCWFWCWHGWTERFDERFCLFWWNIQQQSTHSVDHSFYIYKNTKITCSSCVLNLGWSSTAAHKYKIRILKMPNVRYKPYLNLACPLWSRQVQLWWCHWAQQRGHDQSVLVLYQLPCCSGNCVFHWSENVNITIMFCKWYVVN